MDSIKYWIVTIIGILLVLPLIGVTQISAVITNWVIAIGVLAIGILGILNK